MTVVAQAGYFISVSYIDWKRLIGCDLVIVVVVNFIKHQNRAITGERVAARAAPSTCTYVN